MYSSYSTLQRKQLTKQVYTDTQSTYLLVYAPGRQGRRDRPCDPCLPRQHPAAASGLHPCGRRGSTEPAVNSQSQLLHLP